MKIRFRVDEVAERFEVLGSSERSRVRHTILRSAESKATGQIELIERNPSSKGFLAGSEVDLEISAAKDEKKERRR